MRQKNVTLVLLVLLVYASTQSIYEQCYSCLHNTNKVWCATMSKCMNTAQECDVMSSNVTWFNTKSIQNIPEHCITGFLTNTDQCSTINMIAVRGAGSLAANLVMPLYQQPRLVYNTTNEADAIHSPKDFIMGAYFHHVDQEIYENYFFSFNYHVFSYDPYLADTTTSDVAFVDLAVAAQPRRHYQLGFTMLSPVRNATTNQFSHYQCTFAASSDELWIAADYEWIYNGPHIYLGIPLLFIALMLTSSTFICCSHKFKVQEDDKSYWSDDEESIEDLELDSPTVRPRRFMVSSRENLIGSPEVIDVRPQTLVQQIKLFLSVLWDNIRAMFLASDVQLVNVCGTDVYYFNWFQKYLILFSIVCGVLSMVTLYPYYTYSEDYVISFTDFASTTIAAIDFHTKKNSYIYIFFAVTLAIPIIGCLFIYAIRRLARTVVKANNNYGTLYTVMVSSIPQYIRSRQDLIEEFSDRYGRQHIVDAHICFDLAELAENDKQLQKCKKLLARAEREFSHTGKRPMIRVGMLHLTRIDAISYYTERIKRLENLVKDGSKSNRIEATGYGFVTFTTIEMAKFCINDHRIFCFGFSLPTWCCESSSLGYQVVQAPEPTDVLYDNLGYSAMSTRVRQWGTSTVLFLVLVFLYLLNVIYMYVNWWKAQNYSTINEMIFNRTSNYYGIMVLQVLVELAPEIVSAVNEVLRIIVEVLTKYEKHHTKISFRRAILQKTAFFLTVTTVILPFFWTWYKGVWQVALRSKPPFDNYFYFFNALLSQGIVSMMVVLWTIAKSIELGIVFFRLMFELVRTGKMTRPEFDYEVASGFKITILFMMLVYGPLAPIFFLFCIIYFIISFLIDKFFIMFLYEKASDSDGKILNDVADQAAYYLGVTPFFILCMLPTLMSLGKTWLMYIPGMGVVYLIIRFIKNKSQKEADQAIIVGLKEKQQEAQEQEIPAPISPSEFENNIERELQERTHGTSRPTNTQRGFFANIIANWRGRTETQFSTSDIENLGVDVRKLAGRYKHPYLRRLMRERAAPVQQESNQD